MSGPQKTILAVDDEHDITDMLTLLLESEGYRVLTASGGAEALALLEKDVPDLILLDIMMPDVDGHQVCQGVRARRELAKVPVMMLTAKNDIAHIAQAVDDGADGFIVKPFEVDQFLRLVRFRLEGRQGDFYRSSRPVAEASEVERKQLADDERIVFIDLIEPEDCFSIVTDACQGQAQTLLSLWQEETRGEELQTTALVRVESTAHFGEFLNTIFQAPGVQVLNCFIYRGFADIPSDIMPGGQA